MPCYFPLKGWRAATPNASGKRSIIFNRKHAFIDLPVTLPCGQCTGCRLERSRQWAIRCVHEAQMHEDNSYLTLTFNDECLPSNRSLEVRTLQLFIKRLRQELYPTLIRFYGCGEYGSKYGRPHYHAIIFGYDFPDKTLFKIENGFPLFISEQLKKIWPFGYHTIGSVTFESAAYVARYILKKVNGDQAHSHYEIIDTVTGEITQLLPEFTNMSRRPGIGSTWFERFHKDVYPSDQVIIRSREMRPPKYYDDRFEILSPREHAHLKAKRKRDAKAHEADNTPQRLAVKLAVQISKLKYLPRKVEQ